MNNETFELYIRHLESAGYPMKPIWAHHRERVEKESLAKPDEHDLLYTCPTVKPTIAEHVWRGQKQVLSASNAFRGYSYTLSPGQRQWLKDHYGLTPTETVTVIELGLWPENHPRQLILRSDEHIDPRRRHVLNKVTLSRPGKFFHEAAQIDALLEQMRPRHGLVTAVLSKHVVSVTVAGTEIKKVLTPQITSLVVNDEVMIAWSSKLDKQSGEMVDEWKVTKRLSPSEVSSGNGTRRAKQAVSLTDLLKELEGVVT